MWRLVAESAPGGAPMRKEAGKQMKKNLFITSLCSFFFVFVFVFQRFYG